MNTAPDRSASTSLTPDVTAIAHGATVIHPGAAAGVHRWPVERWAVIARTELAAGHRVVVTGSKGEVALAHELARLAGLPSEAVLAGRTDAGGLAAVVSVARCVACSDTAVAGVARAAGTPSVVLRGPDLPNLRPDDVLYDLADLHATTKAPPWARSPDLATYATRAAQDLLLATTTVSRRRHRRR